MAIGWSTSISKFQNVFVICQTMFRWSQIVQIIIRKSRHPCPGKWNENMLEGKFFSSILTTADSSSNLFLCDSFVWVFLANFRANKNLTECKKVPFNKMVDCQQTSTQKVWNFCKIYPLLKKTAFANRTSNTLELLCTWWIFSMDKPKSEKIEILFRQSINMCNKIGPNKFTRKCVIALEVCDVFNSKNFFKDGAKRWCE